MSRTIGFVGLGNMGKPMADNVAAAGHDMVCFDAVGTDGRLPAGASAAASVSEVVQRVDTLLLSVPDGTVTAIACDISVMVPTAS